MPPNYRQLSLRVVGADYENRRPKQRGQINRRFEIAACEPGEPVTLVLEPDNPVDPNAIMVLSARNIQIGYISADRALFLGKQIREGADVEAIFQSPARWGAVVRVSLDGSRPLLPEIIEQAAVSDDIDPSGFWPDPIWPDT